MIKVLISRIKGRLKTDIRGFWRDERGKVHYDYLAVMEFNSFPSHKWIQRQCEMLKQKCIAIKEDNTLAICYSSGKIEKLNQRKYREIKNLRVEIKDILKKYNGVTVYKIDNKYFAEIYYNE